MIDQNGIPDRIYLQVHGDAPPDEWDEPIDIRAGDVTWCWERIFDGDVEYIRADIAEKEVVELVEAAYREGHSDGVRAFGDTHQTPTDKLNLDWYESRAQAALAHHAEKRGGGGDGR